MPTSWPYAAQCETMSYIGGSVPLILDNIRIRLNLPKSKVQAKRFILLLTMHILSFSVSLGSIPALFRDIFSPCYCPYRIWTSLHLCYLSPGVSQFHIHKVLRILSLSLEGGLIFVILHFIVNLFLK